jgi:biopolymer transport protein ExbB
MTDNPIVNGFNYLVLGGPVMWPLFLCAIISVAVMVERFISITRAAKDNEGLLDTIREQLQQGRVKEAQSLADQASGPVAQLIASGIRASHMNADSIERQMEELALREQPTLYKRLGVLDTIITLSPLLGLLGTVTGMIRAFHVVGTQGLNGATGITSGVAEALIATATGLAIAIVTLVGYNYLTEKVKEIIADMEIRATQLMNILIGIRSQEGRPGEATTIRA